MAQDAIALIKADHRKVEQLFREFEEAGDRAYKTKQDLVADVIKELEVHATIEEETYYPAVEAKARKDGKDLVAEAVEEHHVVKILLGELRSMSSEDEAFDAKVTVLMENVRHHVQEEEGAAPAVRGDPRQGGADPPRRGDGGPQEAARRRLTTGWTARLPFTLNPGEREVGGAWPTVRARASDSTGS